MSCEERAMEQLTPKTWCFQKNTQTLEAVEQPCETENESRSYRHASGMGF